MRQQSVPLRVVRRWNALLEGDTMPPLAEHAATAAALTDEQLELLTSLLMNGRGALRHQPTFSMPATRHALRLYASLTPLQQQALWRGKPLPAATMTPAQRERFLAPRRDRQEASDDAEPSAEPAAPPVSLLGPESHFRMTVEWGALIVEKRGNSTHFDWKTASGPSPSAPAATRTASPARGPRTATSQTRNKTRHALARVSFQFEYGPGLMEATQVNAAPDQGSCAPRQIE
jgi:hypothetical protein